MYTLQNTTLIVNILNTIRDSASANYRDYIPVALPTQNSISEIGTLIMESLELQKEFLNELVSRIGCVFENNDLLNNASHKTMNEILVNIVKPFEYSHYVYEQKVYSKEIPDHDGGFYILIHHNFYTISVHNKEIKRSFFSLDGITDLIMNIIYSMYICRKHKLQDNQ